MKNTPLQEFVNSVLELAKSFDFANPKKKQDTKKSIWLKKVTPTSNYDINALKK